MLERRLISPHFLEHLVVVLPPLFIDGVRVQDPQADEDERYWGSRDQQP